MAAARRFNARLAREITGPFAAAAPSSGTGAPLSVATIQTTTRIFASLAWRIHSSTLPFSPPSVTSSRVLSSLFRSSRAAPRIAAPMSVPCRLAERSFIRSSRKRSASLSSVGGATTKGARVNPSTAMRPIGISGRISSSFAFAKVRRSG